VNFGVIGYGYWGPNIVRNLMTLEDSHVIAIADVAADSRQRAQKALPSIPVIANPAEIIASTKIDAVAVISPAASHFELAKAALKNGKHVFVEKPFTSNAAQAEELVNLAQQKNLRIMVDHTFLFTGAVKKIREVVQEGTLGNLYYYDSTRVNLGNFQHDVNVVWDLAPHDLSIMDHILEVMPEAVVACGQNHLNSHEDVAFMTLYFPHKVIAHINVNWLSPVKVRTTLIGGEKRMLVWNDLEADEKVKIYDRGVEATSKEGYYQLFVNCRSGDMYAPRLEQIEALRQELTYFIECITTGTDPFNDGNAGLRVVKMLEAATKSLRSRGSLVYL
jgi:predicted dehydrogenase